MRTALINSYRDTITTQNDLISQYTSEATALNNSIKDYQGQITTLNEQKAAISAQVDTLNTIKASNETTITELNVQIAALSTEIMSLQGNKNENERQIAALTEQLTNLQMLNTQLQENNALNAKTINGLNAQIASLNNQISDLTLQAQNNNSVVNALNVKIAELQKSVSYYEQYLSTLENGEQVVATFEFDGSVYNIQIVNKNSLLTVATPPSTAYVIFNGWTVDGEPIDLATYRITANTKIVADVTHKYEVNFMVDGENYHNAIILKNANITPPAAPTKNGYVFEGWTIDGNSVVNLTTYTVTQNVTFTAKFTKLYSVVFKYEETTLKNETVKSGNYATAPTASSTAYKVFNGWKVNGVAVNVNEYRITADTVFVADITYKYDVKFIADGKMHNTQIVERNGKPTVPANPTKTNYVFVGWSVDGTNTVNVSNYTVTENVTFTAVFRIQSYTVTFKNNDKTVSMQTVEHGKYATVPVVNIENFAGWSLDGENIVDLESYAITENVTFTAVVNQSFNANSPLFGTWLGKCVGENADEANEFIRKIDLSGNPLEIKAVSDTQFSLLTTFNIPMGYPLKMEISELTNTTIKYNALMHSNIKFDLRYDVASDTLVGTVTFTNTSEGTNKVYNIVYERTEKSSFIGFSGTPFNYNDFS